MSNPKRLVGLSLEEKRALLARILQKKAGEPRFYPLSFAQRRLWILDQLAPGNPVYNLYAALSITGPLHVAVAERVLNEIVRRHEVLRTTFATVGGQPVQVIAPTLILTLPVVDCRELAAPKREAAARRLVLEEAQRPFDLARGPLLRVTLLRLGDEEHILVVSMHHIISDGWSVRVLIREMMALYDAFATGAPSRLPDLPIQYADYAVWQRQWLQGEVLETLLAYWKKQLAGISVLELPTDRPRPAVQTYRGAIHSLVLRASLSERLKALSRREGVTLFMTLLAALQTLLHRYTGQNDIVVGSPVAGRNRLEIEGLIGCFVNTLVLRTDFTGNPTFRELLGRVREVALGAATNQDLPFERQVEELRQERDWSRIPLFQVMFVLQNVPVLAPGYAGVALRRVDLHNGTAKFDLSLELFDTDEGLSGWFEYATDLFEAATIVRTAGHFGTLLEGIVANPDGQLSDLPVLTRAERQQLRRWNDTRVEYPRVECLQGLVEAQVERTPRAVAVVFEEQQLTYRELSDRANQLAGHLRALGVGPDEIVGICMERSVEMIVGLLGILKAGGAYVPLDPADPQERLAFVLKDAGVRVLLTQEALRARLLEHAGHVICVDTDWTTIARQSARVPISTATAENLAYVIYTSGSTGTPKGAMNVHRAVCNRLLWMQDAYRLTPGDRVLQKTPFTFDVSVWEFFWPLSSGAALVVARPGGHRDSAYLAKLVAEQKITTLHFVPSMLQVFLGEPGLGERCRSLRQVFCSGEPLPLELQERFFARLDATLHNLYGPTEAAIDVTFWQCVRGCDRLAVPIGRPIANTQIYLLDAHMKAVPIGLPGEVYIGGASVARGYLNRPDLTAEKFVPNPFGERGTRLYRTGDLARYLPDGNIDFLGRVDHQVKIRGFRVEPGEIEALLGQHPDVRATVVMAREDGPAGKRLVAYVATNHQPAPSTSDLRAFLKHKLPEYMVPSAFVILEALPLTPNGKVDRRALPAPDPERPELANAFVAPRTPTEGLLAEIWTEVLGIEGVGVNDNFFDLGGASIQCLRVVAQANEAGLRITPAMLFEHQTIGELAAALEAP